MVILRQLNNPPVERKVRYKMRTEIRRAVVTDRDNTVTVELVGYDYKEIAWVVVQLMDCATHREHWTDTPATIVAVDSDFNRISFKDIDAVTIMAFMRELVDFDEVVETMTNNGIACQWELSNW